MCPMEWNHYTNFQWKISVINYLNSQAGTSQSNYGCYWGFKDNKAT